MKHLIFRKHLLTDLSRRWKKAIARLYWKGWKMICLRKRTSRFWIIGFIDVRNWRRKIIVICWRNWEGWFKSNRKLRAWKCWATKRELSSGICERTRTEWVIIKTVFLNHSITKIWKCGRETKIRKRHRNSKINGNW